MAPRVGRDGVQLSLIGSGKYSDVFRVHPPRSSALIMKVSYYRSDTICNVMDRIKAGDLRGAMRHKRRDSIQVGAAFARLTAGLMGTVSPHFVFVYCELDCRLLAPKLGPLLKNRLKELTPLQQRFNSVCFMEVFHANMTKLLAAGGGVNDDALRGMLFQVLYTVAAVQKRMPGFRHNDLSTNNVLVKRLRRRPLLAYSFGGHSYYVWSRLLPALSDYDFVNVPGREELRNERVTSGKYKVDGRRNDSYDSHLFLKSVLKCIHRRGDKFPATTAFLARLKMKEEDRQNSSVFPHLRPAVLLLDSYFAPLKTKPPGSGAPAASYAP